MVKSVLINTPPPLTVRVGDVEPGTLIYVADRSAIALKTRLVNYECGVERHVCVVIYTTSLSVHPLGTCYEYPLTSEVTVVPDRTAVTLIQELAND